MTKLARLAAGAVAALALTVGLVGVSLGVFAIGVWQASGAIHRALNQAHAEAQRAAVPELPPDPNLVVATVPSGERACQTASAISACPPVKGHVVRPSRI
jgi:hypothetical protein